MTDQPSSEGQLVSPPSAKRAAVSVWGGYDRRIADRAAAAAGQTRPASPGDVCYITGSLSPAVGV